MNKLSQGTTASSSSWSYDLGLHSSFGAALCSDSESESSSPCQLPGATQQQDAISGDALLLKELDLSSRPDEAVFKQTPWTIAKINALSRPSQPVPQPASKPTKKPDLPTGLIVDAFKKQTQRLSHQHSQNALTAGTFRTNSQAATTLPSMEPSCLRTVSSTENSKELYDNSTNLSSTTEPFLAQSSSITTSSPETRISAGKSLPSPNPPGISTSPSRPSTPSSPEPDEPSSAAYDMASLKHADEAVIHDKDIQRPPRFIGSSQSYSMAASGDRGSQPLKSGFDWRKARNSAYMRPYPTQSSPIRNISPPPEAQTFLSSPIHDPPVSRFLQASPSHRPSNESALRGTKRVRDAYSQYIEQSRARGRIDSPPPPPSPNVKSSRTRSPRPADHYQHARRIPQAPRRIASPAERGSPGWSTLPQRSKKAKKASTMSTRRRPITSGAFSLPILTSGITTKPSSGAKPRVVTYLPPPPKVQVAQRTAERGEEVGRDDGHARIDERISPPSRTVTASFDPEKMYARYTKIRRVVKQRRESKNEIWDVLDLPSCGVVYCDPELPGSKSGLSSEIAIVPWDPDKSTAA
ncbi:hypothetical protein BXZ70DRAFT_735011 [Cristinia sonorae]|uniref:Uncharacterized protein n=1 Tax=Cristinia sonorae TaxID=1940300 RepID=A0A8K0XSV9_9AGAR|nr:hypothetical protein BXZ70DRAFT_735011 [Cristinia sonorae]